jgi:hypothetical protein
MSRNPDLLSHLPDSIMLHSVFSFLTPEDLRQLTQVNSTSRRCTTQTSCSHVWKAHCKRRWGHHVPDDTVADFRAYFVFRSRKWRAPQSPASLIQELYCCDPWKLIISCLLCSRTSGSAVVHATIADFFIRYPTPSHVLDADVSSLAALLLPLGLNRERVITRTASGFLASTWTGGIVSSLYGCGRFTHDSWRVFCRRELLDVIRSPDSDRNVRAYATYAASQELKLASHSCPPVAGAKRKRACKAGRAPARKLESSQYGPATARKAPGVTLRRSSRVGGTS